MGINVFIVEADELFRRNLVHRLRLEKYRVFETGLKTEVKKIIKRKNIDVVLLGLCQLKQEGLSLLKAIKEIRPMTEVILMNSADQISLSIEGMKIGAFDDMLVPFDLKSLLKRIQGAFFRKREREKTKRSLFKSYQGIMIAATFAEAGEQDIALKLLNKNGKRFQKVRGV